MSIKKKSIEQKKSVILQSATKLFAEKGYEATTMAEIAKLSDVSFGSVSTYFENKETLLYKCVEDPLETYLNELLDFNVYPENFHRELEEMTTKHFLLFQEHRIYLLLLVQMIAQNEKYYKPYLLVHEGAKVLTERLEQFVQNGQKAKQLEEGNCNTIAVSYVSLLFGLYLSNPHVLNKNALSRFAQTSIRLFGLK